MKNYFTFDGVESSEYNVFIAESNMFDSANERVETITIPGRNGVLHTTDGTFEPFIAKLKCYIPTDMQNHVDELRSFLLSRNKLCVYKEAFRPDEFRWARYMDSFTLGQSDRNGAAIELDFQCQPERWLMSGLEVVTLSATGTIENPTDFNCKPLLRIYQTGVITIGDTAISVNAVDGYIDIDCDSMQAYKEDVNCNSDISLNEFPVLVPGVNTITLDGITQVDITPRWYTL